MSQPAVATAVWSAPQPEAAPIADSAAATDPVPVPKDSVLSRHLRQIMFGPGYLGRLQAIDASLAGIAQANVPALFAQIPLDVFGLLLVDRPDSLPNITAYFPTMPPHDFQVGWVGSSGVELLVQSLQFVRSVVAAYERHGKKPLAESRVLDYGVGWGRLLRLMYKFVPEQQLFGADGWQSVLDVARDLALRGNLFKIDEYPERLLEGARFDLVYLFSIFTHLSEIAHLKALSAIHQSLDDDGVLVVTVRPAGYWRHARHPDAAALEAAHGERGFAYSPHGGPASGPNGDVPYGDSSISFEYIEKNWNGWRVLGTDFNLSDPYQVLVILKKA